MYQLKKKILDKYADVLVNYGLNKGKGIRKGEVVLLIVPECAKPLLLSLQRAVLKAGALFITRYVPEGIAKEYYQLANDNQLSFFPDKLFKGQIEQIDHSIFIESTSDKHELEGIEPRKLMLVQKSYKPYMEWRNEKENKGKFSWTLALYGTEAMAKEVGLSLKEYWEQIIKACYLDISNPVKKWRELQAENDKLRRKLDSLKIEKLHIEAKGTDLIAGLGKNRRWLGGTGANIPSYEVYISPDARMTEGHVTFTEPLYRYGNLITGVKVWFKNGRVVKATARKGQKILREMLAVEGADRIGEFSLTDARMSKIAKFMGETLFDENVGGKFGNMHIAFGNAYKDSFSGNPSRIPKKKWKEMGYNESVIHTDIVSTADKKVTAYLSDGKRKIIYKSGKFLV